MQTNPSRTTIAITVLIPAITIFIIFFLVMPKVREGREQTPPANTSDVQITNFLECAEAGNDIMESWPRKCRFGDQTFTENIGNELEKTDLIRVESPRPSNTVISPIVITGEASGYWFFEGEFPVMLTDWDGRIIGNGHAVAQGEWMTDDFVAFQATVTYEDAERYKDNGTLILQKNNPSDNRDLDDALEIPVILQ